MRFAPSPDQLDLADALRSALAGAEDAPAVVAEFGLRDLLADGGDESLLVTAAEQIGYAGVPVPAADTFAFAPGLLAAAGVEAGAWVAADPAGVGFVDVSVGPELLLSGGFGGVGSVRIGRFVGDLSTAGPHGAVESESAVRPLPAVASQSAVGGPSAAGNLLTVGSQSAMRPLTAVDPQARLVAVGEGTVEWLAEVTDPDVIALSWHRGVVAAAAELVGLARRMLDLTVAYVGQRHQFGVPVGSFQAVKHQLADVALAVEFAAPVVASAAAMLAGGHGIRAEVRVEVSAAKALASDAALLSARTAIQCHGAMGYTTEYPLHLFAKRAWALASAWGSPDDHRASVADLIIPAP